MDINFSLPDAERVLVLAPHPDDETLGCGGIIALYASKGTEVHAAIISDGGAISHEFGEENLDIIDIRKREAQEAANILGIRRTYFLGFPDGELESCKNEIGERLKDIIAAFHPDIIFSPSPVDYHKDHIAVSETALRLLTEFPVKLAFFEIYETIRFNFLIDITSVMDVKSEAVLKYEYSLFHAPTVFWEAVKGLNRFRSFYTRGNNYYEAFWVISSPMEKPALLDWLSYGLGEMDPALVYLSKIKAVDHLLFEIKKCHEQLRSRDREMQGLIVLAENREKDLQQTGIQLDAITKSLIWRFATRFYRVRDVLVPAGTMRRRFYDDLLYRFKSNVKH